MEFVPLSSLKKDFYFEPEKPWPKSLPAYGWQNQLLAGFDRKEGSALILNGDLIPLFHQLYPTLSLIELSQTFAIFSKHPETRSHLQEWLEPYGLKFSQRLIQFFEKLQLVSPKILQWCNEKKLRARDLEILNAFSSLNDFNFLIEKLLPYGISKSRGVQLFEVIGELLLMNKKDEVLQIFTINSLDAIEVELKRIRFPLSSEKLTFQKKELANFSWPSHVKPQWIRKGDSTKLKLEMELSSFDDFEKKLKLLSQVNLNMQKEELWP
ncbi:MAG: hypothetical protein KDD34_01625 [Bdellovibrionales bacterium]|nr:hypothetical protein [Bdellovibrionales bacterium]